MPLPIWVFQNVFGTPTKEYRRTRATYIQRFSSLLGVSGLRFLSRVVASVLVAQPSNLSFRFLVLLVSTPPPTIEIGSLALERH